MAKTDINSGSEQTFKDSPPHEKPPWFRETVESFGVALILAFLFRAFVAEAFVIPTGSMAPTLMGAHKDVRCPECGVDYQSGASLEFDELGSRTDSVCLTTTCPLCRFELPLDLANNPNHWTFSGDRILVSKFAYMFRKPKRWEVIVFKFPDDARINYIKRCVGLSNEKLQVYNGDIFVTKKGESKPEIERKPPNVVNTMLQAVYDSNHLPKSLIKSGLPNAWQPFPKDGLTWQTTQTETEWRAQCDASSANAFAWLRYYHRVFGPENVRTNTYFANQAAPTRLSWDMATDMQAGLIDPYFSAPIFDFTAYNSSLIASSSLIRTPDENRGRPRSLIGTAFKTIQDLFRKAKPNENYRSGENPRRYLSSSQFAQSDGRREVNFLNDGVNWVGDLACEFDINLEGTSGSISLDLVEAGLHHTCTIDVATGKATLEISKDGKAMSAFVDGESRVQTATADTSVRAGRVRLKFANVDDQLLLWVNGRLQKLTGGGRFDIGSAPGLARSPEWTPSDPLDAAPVGLGVKGVKATVLRSRVWRDVYYIATGNGDSNINPARAQEDLLNPANWSANEIIARRRTGTYTLGEDEYFPMGDNSPSSSDARVWGSLPENLLIGRAILVFWPHHWNRPIPFTPNIKRFRLIR